MGPQPKIILQHSTNYSSYRFPLFMGGSNKIKSKISYVPLSQYICVPILLFILLNYISFPTYFWDYKAKTLLIIKSHLYYPSTIYILNIYNMMVYIIFNWNIITYFIQDHIFHVFWWTKSNKSYIMMIHVPHQAWKQAWTSSSEVLVFVQY